MADFLKRSWATVDLDAISHNIEQIKGIVRDDCRILAVVKADAYGHGAKYVARELNRHGADWFGVSNIDEAVSLRRDGIFKPILIFGVTPVEYAKTLCEYSITQAVFSLEYAKKLSDAAKEQGVTVDAHVKIDTGMGRLGFCTDECNVKAAADEVEKIYALPNIKYTGIFTHFSCADEKAEDSVNYTKMQFERFCGVINELKNRGYEVGIRHCCNSAATMMHPEMQLDMVRPGVIIYGLSPSSDCENMLDLRPAMQLKCVVSQVKTVPKGTSISYGRTYVSDSERRIASVTIGYADGYHRILSNRARMIVRGKFADVVGRVCMDQLMLDVTDIDGVCEGDEVTIFGTDGDKTLSADEMAALTNSINYEVVCLIGKRVPRIYLKDSKQIGVTSYVGSACDKDGI